MPSAVGNVGGAIASVSQSYSFTGAAGHHASSNGSIYSDNVDTCDDLAAQPAGANARCVIICGPPTFPTQEDGMTIPAAPGGF